MNFLQKIISKSVLKSLETLSKNDPKIRSQWEELGRASEDLAKSIDVRIKKDREMGLRRGNYMDI